MGYLPFYRAPLSFIWYQVLISPLAAIMILYRHDFTYFVDSCRPRSPRHFDILSCLLFCFSQFVESMMIAHDDSFDYLLIFSFTLSLFVASLCHFNFTASLPRVTHAADAFWLASWWDIWSRHAAHGCFEDMPAISHYGALLIYIFLLPASLSPPDISGRELVRLTSFGAPRFKKPKYFLISAFLDFAPTALY